MMHNYEAFAFGLSVQCNIKLNAVLRCYISVKSPKANMSNSTRCSAGLVSSDSLGRCWYLGGGGATEAPAQAPGSFHGNYKRLMDRLDSSLWTGISNREEQNRPLICLWYLFWSCRAAEVQLSGVTVMLNTHKASRFTLGNKMRAQLQFWAPWQVNINCRVVRTYLKVLRSASKNSLKLDISCCALSSRRRLNSPLHHPSFSTASKHSTRCLKFIESIG